MVRLSRLSEIARKSALTHPCQINDETPWTALARPLSASRLALVTTAGIHARGDRPFGPGDPGYREFPTGLPLADIVQSHASIGFDRTAFQQDPNVVLPVERMTELVARGQLGSLGPTVYAFMGAQRPPYDRLMANGRAVADRLRSDGVDVVFLTGT
jgi:D-proline reductase (dithiol) PrdB